mgnify:CR=1 FL=1
MNKQESNTSFHLKDESTKTGKLPVSEQYLEDKEIQDQTEQLKNQTDISTEGLTETAILRLKAEQTSANKSNGISGVTHSISTSYHEAVREQQASDKTAQEPPYLCNRPENHNTCCNLGNPGCRYLLPVHTSPESEATR